MENAPNRILECFLKDLLQYTVLHESGTSNSQLEHFFIAITVNDVKDSSVKHALETYTKNFPLVDLSQSSKNYILKKNKEYYFIFLDTLDKTDVFFAENEKLLRNNFHNILSRRIIGESVDLVNHIENTSSKYFSQFKDLSLSVGSLLKDEIKKGIVEVQKKKPSIVEKMAKIKSGLKK